MIRWMREQVNQCGELEIRWRIVEQDTGAGEEITEGGMKSEIVRNRFNFAQYKNENNETLRRLVSAQVQVHNSHSKQGVDTAQ